MQRRTWLLVIGVLLAGTYAWQIFETLVAGQGVRILHVGGLALAIVFVALHVRSGSASPDE